MIATQETPATTDEEWLGLVAGMQATWRDCPLTDDPDRRAAYRRALRRVPAEPLALAIDMLAATRDRFPSIADFAAAVAEIRSDMRREAEAQRIEAQARAAVTAPHREGATLADFDAHREEIVAQRKSELQEFARRQGHGPDWLAQRFAEAEKRGPRTEAMRGVYASGGSLDNAMRAAGIAVMQLGPSASARQAGEIHRRTRA